MPQAYMERLWLVAFSMFQEMLAAGQYREPKFSRNSRSVPPLLDSIEDREVLTPLHMRLVRLT